MLATASQTGTSATVELRSVASHVDRVDRCAGTVDLVRGRSGWMLDFLRIAGCQTTPVGGAPAEPVKPGGGTKPGKGPGDRGFGHGHGGHGGGKGDAGGGD